MPHIQKLSRASKTIFSAFVVFALLVNPVLVFAEGQDGGTDSSSGDTSSETSNTDTTQKSPTTTKDKLTQQTEEGGGGEQSLGYGEYDGPAPNSDQVSKEGNKPVKTDLNSGALTYSYDINVPPGRGDLTPDLKLKYNSQTSNLNSVFGYGWSISIPYIERINKEGSEKLYTTDYYTSSMSGELEKLSSTSYVAKTEDGSFLVYEFSSNIWTVTDKEGTVYTFGDTASSRQDNPSDSTKIYKWMLNEIRDTNGNYITYEYYKDAGQIYPETITYTGNGITDGIFTVNFTRESRADVGAMYTTGFSVKTNYRISEIRADINTTWAKKYELDYTTADNANNSLLDTITESGQVNSVTTTLPATDFDYSTSTPGWTYNSTWNLPIPIIDSNNDIGIRFGDINGDGLVDIVCSNEINNVTCGKNNPAPIYLNNGAGWTSVAGTWVMPTRPYNNQDREAFVGTSYQDLGLRLIDVNGDGLADLVKGDGGLTSNYVYINNGSGWTYDSSWSLPLPFIHQNGLYDYGMRMDDINGDNLPDIACHNEYVNGICDKSNHVIFLNNGSGWTNVSSSWAFPGKQYTYNPGEATTETFVESNGNDRGLRLLDINGDKLADLIKADGSLSSNYVYLNNGSGWIYDSLWNFPIPVIKSSGLVDFGMRLAEINGDGLVDIVCHGEFSNGSCSRNDHVIFLNNGSNTLTNISSSWSLPAKQGGYSSGEATTETFVEYNGVDRVLRAIDVNGDNISDVIKAKDNFRYTYINNTTSTTNLLSTITYPHGGSTEIEYKPSTAYKDGSSNLLNPSLPLIVDTVYTVTDDDGVGNSNTTEYEYEGGSYYYNTATDRKFAGFAEVKQINPDDTSVISYFSQGDSTNTSAGEYDDHVSKIGKVYRVDVLDDSDDLVKQTTTKWEKSQIGSSGAYYVYPVQTIEKTFTGSSSYNTAEEYSYDTSNGNLDQKVEYGEVSSSSYQTFSDTGTDKKTTNYDYATCSSCDNLQLVSQIEVKDYSNSIVSETNMYYDNQGFGVATLGNNTKEEKWISGANYATTLKSYNTYGLVLSVTDPRSYTTTYSYDTYNLYPATVTNPLSQATTYTYDYVNGKVKQTVDPNGTKIEKDYDGLGRIEEERSSSDSSYTTLITTAEYDYNDTLSGSSVPYIKKTTNYSSTLSGISYELLDGLSRKVRDVVQVAPSSYVGSDTVYDSMGRVYKTSLPYTLSGTVTSYSGPTTNTNLITTSTYDALSRPLTTTNTLGTVSYDYNLNTTTITDQESNDKDVARDAFGRIIEVVEYEGGNDYTTSYTWNTLGNLTGIEDELGNVRSFTYDPQGNMLTSTDLHDTSDSTYGIYSYTYDKNNNMTVKNTPNGDTITYVYDALNRPTNESNNSTTQISYTYDSCASGIGKLCAVTRTGSALETYSYTKRGLLDTTLTTLSPSGWGTSYTYDYQGNISEITYPDSSKVRYTRDNRGLITKIEQQESGGSWADIISSVTYNALGQKLVVSYANTRTQTYSYDSSKQYRLGTNVLDAPVGYPYTNIFELSYAWSDTGNLTQMVDGFDPSNPQTFTYTYDDLYRLTEAQKTVNAPLTGYTENYSYNEIGNIMSKTNGGSTYTYNSTGSGVYANPHAVTSVDSINYTYDANGNLTDWGVSPTNTVLTYNYRNEMTQYVDNGTSVNMSMLYNHNGDRIKVTDSSGITFMPNKYYEDKAPTITKYIYLNDQLVASIETTSPSAPVKRYIHPDHLGGTKVVTDQGGLNVLQTLEYYPYGQILSNTGSTDERHKYTGHEYDTDTDLNYMNARYQYGVEGRFFQQDPVFISLDKDKLSQFLLDPQMQNSYSYSRDNPLKYVDQDGEWIETASDIASLLLSVNDFRQDPSLKNAAFVGLDIAGTALPFVPAVAGLVRHGDDVAKLAKTSEKVGDAAKNTGDTLYHYTNEKGMQGILDSKKINPSLKANNPKDAFYGEGQYLSDILPGTKSDSQLSRNFIGNPFQGQKFSNYIEIDVSGLDIFKGRDGVYLNPSNKALDVSSRIKNSGKNLKK